MSRIVIVSNRLPFSVKNRDGEWKIERIVSGLVTALEDFKSKFNQTIWIGWEGINDINYERSLDSQIKDNGFINIDLNKDVIEKGYNGL